MGTTITIDLKKQKFVGVRAHNKRAGNPSNENIKQELTKYNKRRVVEAYDDIIEDNLGDYVREHDKKSRKSRQFGSVKKLVSKDNYNPEITAVTTFGNKSVKEKLVSDFESQGVSYEQITDAFHKACDVYFLGDEGNGTQSFNERNNGKLRLSEYHTHVDESTFHVHSYVVGCGWTEKGNPAKGWDHALRQLYNGEGNNKSRMSRWRSEEDQVFYDCCMQSYEQLANEHGVKFNKEDYNFMRLNPDDGDRGLDMETYQAKQDIKKRESRVANRERDVDDATDKFVKFLQAATGSKEKNFYDIYVTFGKQLVNERVGLDVLKKNHKKLEKTYNGLKTQRENLVTDIDTLKNNHKELVKTCNGLKTKKMNLETEISDLEENKQSLDSVIADNQAAIDAENQRHLQEIEKIKENNKKKEAAERAKIEKEKKDQDVRRQAINELQKDPEFLSEARADVGERIYNNLSEERKGAYIKHFMKQDPANIDGMLTAYITSLRLMEDEGWDAERARVQQRFNFDLYTQKMNEINAEYENAKDYKSQKGIIAGRKAVKNKAKKDLGGLEL